MISYFTSVFVNDRFNEDILLEMFVNWMQTTKNKMEGFPSIQKYPFYYAIDRKKFKVDQFEDGEVVAIQFVTTDNRKDARFIVEVVYYVLKQQLDLVFYKEVTELSKYISAVSMPNIFRDLLNSEYIRLDKTLKISEEPTYYRYNDYRSMKKQKHRLPLVVLTKNQKCVMNPHLLAKSILGLGHVVVVYSKVEPSLNIYYPDGQEEKISGMPQKQMMGIVEDKLRTYSISQLDLMTYDDFLKMRIEKERQSNEALQLEYQEYSELRMQESKAKYEDLYELYQALNDELLILQKQNKEMQQRINNFDHAPLIVSDKEDVQEEKALLTELINQEIVHLTNNEIFRRKDILDAIKRRNKL